MRAGSEEHRSEAFDFRVCMFGIWSRAILLEEERRAPRENGSTEANHPSTKAGAHHGNLFSKLKSTNLRLHFLQEARPDTTIEPEVDWLVLGLALWAFGCDLGWRFTLCDGCI